MGLVVRLIRVSPFPQKEEAEFTDSSQMWSSVLQRCGFIGNLPTVPGCVYSCAFRYFSAIFQVLAKCCCIEFLPAS
jgi:hypothetical protein